MARLVWDTMTERYYETGVDRGVLFAPSFDGVPWNGLTSVTENPNGGEPRPLYIDGIKYGNLATAEEFEATIVAFSTPTEFAFCDGTVQPQNGLFVPHQKRIAFGFSYRTNIGRGIDGPDYAYKVHLVYGALASPPTRNNKTRTNTVEPTDFSWDITCLPPVITGYRRTAHLFVDSRYSDPEILADFEDILYGTDAEASRLPDPDELLTLFTP